MLSADLLLKQLFNRKFVKKKVFKLIWFKIKFPFYFCRVSGQNLGQFGKSFEMLKILMVWENLTELGSGARRITHGLQVTYAPSQWPGWDNSHVFASSLFSTSCSTNLSVMDMLSPCSDLSYKKASVLHTPRMYPQGLTHNRCCNPSFLFSSDHHQNMEMPLDACWLTTQQGRSTLQNKLGKSKYPC